MGKYTIHKRPRGAPRLVDPLSPETAAELVVAICRIVAETVQSAMAVHEAAYHTPTRTAAPAAPSTLYNLAGEVLRIRERPNLYRTADPPTAFLLHLVRLVDAAVHRAMDEYERSCGHEGSGGTAAAGGSNRGR